MTGHIFASTLVRDGEDYQTNVWSLAHGWYQRQNTRMPFSCWDFSSWNISCPGGTTLISKGSCGHCREDSGSTHALHDGRPGRKHPAAPLGNHYGLHLERNFSFRSLFPGTDKSFEMQFALPELQQGTTGSMFCSMLRVASKTRNCSVAPHPYQSS